MPKYHLDNIRIVFVCYQDSLWMLFAIRIISGYRLDGVQILSRCYSDIIWILFGFNLDIIRVLFEWCPDSVHKHAVDEDELLVFYFIYISKPENLICIYTQSHRSPAVQCFCSSLYTSVCTLCVCVCVRLTISLCSVCVCVCVSLLLILPVLC